MKKLHGKFSWCGLATKNLEGTKKKKRGFPHLGRRTLVEQQTTHKTAHTNPVTQRTPREDRETDGQVTSIKGHKGTARDNCQRKQYHCVTPTEQKIKLQSRVQKEKSLVGFCAGAGRSFSRPILYGAVRNHSFRKSLGNLEGTACRDGFKKGGVVKGWIGGLCKRLPFKIKPSPGLPYPKAKFS